MDLIKNIGYIYKITNKINGKLYIGQTTKTIEKRWQKHKSEAFRKNKGRDYPLYKAIRKYGIENFEICLVEECIMDKLDEREIYWIKYYNSTKHNGYNISLGGKGVKLFELNEKEVIKYYKNTNNLYKTAEFFNCGHQAIHDILEKHNIEIKTSTEHAKDRGINICQYDNNKKLIHTFQSLTEASNWVKDNKLTKSKDPRKNIELAILKDKKLYGYYWNYEEPNYINKSEKLSKIKERQKIRYKNDKQNSKKTEKKPKTCPVCGKEMSYSSDVCLECYLKEKAQNIPSKEELKDLLIKYKGNLTQISNLFNVSNVAVKKWCNKYDLNVNFYRGLVELNKEKVIDLLLKHNGNIKQCASEYNTNSERIKTFCRNNNIDYKKYKNLKPSRKEIIDALIKTHGNMEELHNIFNKSKSTISGYLKEYNINLKDYKNT